MTDDRSPPLEPDERPPPRDGAEQGASASPVDAPTSSNGAEPVHAGVLDLSAFLDGALTSAEAAAVTDHVAACADCSRELERLRSVRTTLSAAGRPSAPPGAADSALLAAMASVTRTGRKAPASALTDAPAPATIEQSSVQPAPSLPPALPLAPVSSAGAPSTIDLALSAALDAAAADLAADAVAASAPAADVVAASAGAAKTEEPTPPAASRAPSTRAPWMPAAWDAETAKQRAIERHRHVRAGMQIAASVVVLCLIGGAVYGVLRKSGGSSSSAASSTIQRVAGGAVHHSDSTVQSTTTTLQQKPIIKQPPIGALALQLRGNVGPADCSHASLHLVSVNGVLVAVNPPEKQPAVMHVPGAGQTPCVGVGTAFATAWSGVVTNVSIRAIPGSNPRSGPVHLVFSLTAGGVDDQTAFNEAAAGKLTIAVIGQGVDLGTAVVTKGRVVTITAAPLTALFVREQFLPPKHS